MLKLTRKRYTVIAILMLMLLVAILAINIVPINNKVKSANSSNTTTNNRPDILDLAVVQNQAVVYLNKTIRVRGILWQVGKDYYIAKQITSSTEKPVAVKLDFSNTKINPAHYAFNNQISNQVTRGPDHNSYKPVTITGELVAPDHQFVILVSSLTQ